MKLITAETAGLIDPVCIREEQAGPTSATVEEVLELAVDWYLANKDRWRARRARDVVRQRLGKEGR